MRLGLLLYRSLTFLLIPVAPMIMARRARASKENPNRLNERFARQLPARPNGKLLWFHAASVGESLVQLEVASRLLEETPDAHCLFTCQTLTAADTITDRLSEDKVFAGNRHIQQMAPLDLPFVAKRFVQHWHPDLAVFAEGDIWPNLLGQLRKADLPTVLINARMTDKSITGWGRWKETARHVFGGFDTILAADTKTKTGLEFLTGHHVPCPGNLKSSLRGPQADEAELKQLRKQIGERRILVAASTHAGEEALVIDAVIAMSDRPFLIIAPRHPIRGDEIESLLRCSNLAYVRRSADQQVTPRTDVLLADTLGEMGLWYRLANTVYLGGGHAAGVGGHNPVEALRLGRRVITGPSLFNFKDLSEQLIDKGGLTIVNTTDELVNAVDGPGPDTDLLKQLEHDSIGPMNDTIAALQPYLHAGAC